MKLPMNYNWDNYKGCKRDQKATSIIRKVLDRGICEYCEEPKRYKNLKLHHIDCNPLNNDKNNLIIVCTNCHTKIHQKFPNWRFLSRPELIYIVKKALDYLGNEYILVELEGEELSRSRELEILREEYKLLQEKYQRFYRYKHTV